MSVTSQDNTSRSKPHRRVERILDRMRVNYESEYAEFAPYSLDIWLPEWWCAIEVDGPTHSKAKDTKRDDTLLKEHGVKVLHLPTDMNAAHIEITILAFIKHSSRTARERRQVWREATSV